MTLALLASGCAAQKDAVTVERAERPESGIEGRRLANLERAAGYPWTDEGRCAVREASGEWAMLVERCYDALDRSRIRFVDERGAVIVIGAVVVAAAISAEIDAARAKKAGCRCTCLKQGVGPYTGFLRVASPTVCAELCRNHPAGYTGWECK
jgi:hypothetical protein